MQTSELMKTPTAEVALRRPLTDRLPRWLAGWRGLAILGILLVVAGLYAGWGWLAAVGLAPLILSVAPCLVMCAVGLCAMSRGSSSCANQGSPTAPDQSSSSGADRATDR